MSPWVSVAVPAVLVLACVVAGLVGYQEIAVGSEAAAGTPVNASTAKTIQLAALSCPALTGPRLAGQIMANSGFAVDAGPSADAGGVSGLPAKVFASWEPWPKANAEDETASIYALAHYMCDLSGQIRKTAGDGDVWKLALAAYHSGAGAVSGAGGVPDDAEEYVDEVNGYAAWYAQQDEFADATPTAAGSTAPATVPATYALAVGKAGAACPEVTPGRVSAELMAASGFDPNHRSDDGAMGIAGFDSDLWTEYAPAGASPWDPDVAIPLVGSVLCDLVKTVEPMGGDTYANALAALRAGVTAVRQAGGVPNIPSVTAFVQQALSTAYGASPSPPATGTTSAATPTPQATPTSPTSPAEITAPTVVPTTKAPTTRAPVTTSASTAAPTQYKIVNGLSGKVLSVPDGSTTAGVIMVQEPDNGSAGEHWLLIKDADGSVRIKSVLDGLVLSPQNGSTADYAFVAQVADASTPATRWHLTASGSGDKVKNVGSGLLLAIQFQQNTDGIRVFQYDDNGTADHVWTFTPVG
jgi:hypothetical protein